MTNGYISQLIKASESSSGVLFSYDTYHSPYVNFQEKECDLIFSYCANALRNFTFRIGSRILNVDNENPAFSYTNLLLALGKLGSYHSSALTHSNYPRSKNALVYDFQTARDESKHSNSGLNSTNGNFLRLELNFHNSVTESVASPTDNLNLCTLKKVHGYQDVHLNSFLMFSKHMRINASGILIVDVLFPQRAQLHGERCKNRTCQETNKPLCAIHSKKLGDIMQDFHGLSSKRRGDVLKPLSEYLRRRNIQFDLRLVDVPDFEPDVMEKLEKWKATVLAKYTPSASPKRASGSRHSLPTLT
ncbi:hypothetical protein ScalyP_jg8479 [Parmales sp. scaly parma]|nr:hypothetical protein ScalyP_jg8479 [Parmales sp. scaly parma]